MRTRIISAAIGAAIGTVFATCETLGATTEITVPQPIRVWMVAAVISAIIVTATFSILDRLNRIEQLLLSAAPRQAAEHDYESIRQQLHGNITRLYPREQED